MASFHDLLDFHQKQLNEFNDNKDVYIDRGIYFGDELNGEPLLYLKTGIIAAFNKEKCEYRYIGPYDNKVFEIIKHV